MFPLTVKSNIQQIKLNHEKFVTFQEKDIKNIMGELTYLFKQCKVSIHKKRH